MRSIVLLVSLVGVAAAAEPDVASRKADAEFYPTAVGTRWVMVTDYEDGSESYVDDIRIVEEKVVNGYRKWKLRTVSRVREENTLLAIAKAFTPADSDEVFEGWEYYDVGREAYVAKDLTEGFEDKPAYPLVYYPANVQDRFEDEEGLVTTVVAVDRKAKVPAGEFRCIVYELDYSGEGGTKVAWGAPDTRTVPVSFQDEAAEPDAAEEGPAEEEAFADATITVEYWAKGVGLVMTEDFTIEDDGSRTLNSRSRLVSFTVPGNGGKEAGGR